MRKLFVLTGKRGGYGAMKPMLHLLDDAPDFALQLVVTDQHGNERFGRTASEVEKEFVTAAKVDMAQVDGSAQSRAKALARCAMEMTDVLETLRPEMCVLYGDRGEVLATALTATALGTPDLPHPRWRRERVSGQQHAACHHQTRTSAFCVNRSQRPSHCPNG